MSRSKLGIDIGSKTIKVVLLGEPDNTLVFSSYIHHLSKVKGNLLNSIRKLVERLGNIDVDVAVTGSAGMRVAELFGIPFIQEVIALKRAVETLEPECDAVLEMGGEDTKLVYLTGTFEQRMNTVCAGGTGGFIDMMAGLMGKRSSDMQRLALGATSIYPIASRCAVFAKSDVRPLLNAGARKEDVAASVLHAVCEQAVAGLSAGRPIEGKVILLGGPFHYTPALADAFCSVTGLARKDVLVPSNAHLFVATGAALHADETCACTLSELEQMIANADFSDEEGIKRLPALFSDREEYTRFKTRHEACKIPRTNRRPLEGGNYFLGIDAGSTTMKMALINEKGELVTYTYDWNQGDITLSFPRMLGRLYRASGIEKTPNAKLRRSCVIGYGEEFCKGGFRVDMGEVETVAHLRAATEIESEVDFLMDIGGQDIKCFYIKNGQIEDMVLNEACSSGCGSLFDSVARSMHISKDALVDEALYARRPVDLGTRCSTFMDSRVKHAQKEGATQGDIAAGIAYSTARNALFKVVRQPDFSKVGTHIVVQGGAFANDALLRAFELETNVEVIRPDLAQLMGAWGAALLARDEWKRMHAETPEKADNRLSSLMTSEQLDAMRIRRQIKRCELCTNKCQLAVTRFCKDKHDKHGRVLVAGNRCDRGAASQNDMRARKTAPPNLIKFKNALIEKFDASEQPADNMVVGIPRALALYESYPFWKTFFNELGFAVVTSGPSSDEVFRKGMSAIFAEGSCYPSKLMFGHCIECIDRGAQMLFLPKLSTQLTRTVLCGDTIDEQMHECPLIENMPELVMSNRINALQGATCICPDLLEATCLQDMAPALAQACAHAKLPIEPGDLNSALESAAHAQANFYETLQHASNKVLASIDAKEYPGVLIAGHGYHADPGINHGIDELLGKLGYAVIDCMDYRCNQSAHHAHDYADVWQENRELAEAIDLGELHPELGVIICRSFGCGIDAIAADDMYARLRRQGRIFAELKMDQITDLAAVRIRLRSLDYARRAKRGESRAFDAYESVADATQHLQDDEHTTNPHKRRYSAFLRGFGGSDVSKLPGMAQVPSAAPPGSRTSSSEASPRP